MCLYSGLYPFKACPCHQQQMITQPPPHNLRKPGCFFSFFNTKCIGKQKLSLSHFRFLSLRVTFPHITLSFLISLVHLPVIFSYILECMLSR